MSHIYLMSNKKVCNKLSHKLCHKKLPHVSQTVSQKSASCLMSHPCLMSHVSRTDVMCLTKKLCHIYLMCTNCTTKVKLVANRMSCCSTTTTVKNTVHQHPINTLFRYSQHHTLLFTRFTPSDTPHSTTPIYHKMCHKLCHINKLCPTKKVSNKVSNINKMCNINKLSNMYLMSNNVSQNVSQSASQCVTNCVQQIVSCLTFCFTNCFTSTNCLMSHKMCLTNCVLSHINKLPHFSHLSLTKISLSQKSASHLSQQCPTRCLTKKWLMPVSCLSHVSQTVSHVYQFVSHINKMCHINKPSHKKLCHQLCHINKLCPTSKKCLMSHMSHVSQKTVSHV